MPSVVRGDVRWYDFGPTIGRELSGHRPALIISNTEFNKGLSLAIAVPTSTSPPQEIHMINHVRIESTSSWASVLQIKSVEQEKLGDKLGEATSEELEDIHGFIERQLSGISALLGVVQTESGYEDVRRGSIFDVAFNEDDAVQHATMLVLDYNKGNNMAIAVEVEDSQNPESDVRIPINIIGASGRMSALLHRVRSIDFGERDVVKVGMAEEVSTETVIDALMDAIDF